MESNTFIQGKCIQCIVREAGDFYIEPPKVNDLTDEDSGEKDTETGLHPCSLSGNQLRAPAELCSHQNEGADNDEMAVEPVSDISEGKSASN